MAAIYYFCVSINNNGSVVQLNRTSDSGSESRGFESLRSHPMGQFCEKTELSFFNSSKRLTNTAH